MASDVATFITSSGNGFFLGLSTVRADDLGNQAVLHESGAEQFTKMGFNDFVFFNKYNNRFDDPRYYAGDAAG